jgi:hypothetical protein
MKVRPRTIFTLLGLLPAFGSKTSAAATFTLDDVASRIIVAFNDSGGKFTVTHKASGWVWRNPDTLASSTNPSAVTGTTLLADGKTLNANITISGNIYSLVAKGYVVPNTVTTFTLPGGMRGSGEKAVHRHQAGPLVGRAGGALDGRKFWLGNGASGVRDGAFNDNPIRRSWSMWRTRHPRRSPDFSPMCAFPGSTGFNIASNAPTISRAGRTSAPRPARSPT